MKAVRFYQTGGPDVLVYEDVPTPVARPGEVLIRVEAAGINYADTIRRRGEDYPEASPPPFILGVEVAGTVAALGEGVTGPAIGTPVLATPGAGGYAQYIAVPAPMVVPLPPGFDLVLASAIVAHGLSAAVALKHAVRLAPGESILIEGAAGGLGSFLVQLAKKYGAGKVIAAAGTPEKRDAALRLGADAVVDYTQKGWSQQVRALTDGKGVDIVIETAGGANVDQALDALAPFGRMLYVGQSSGETAQIDPWRLTAPNHSVMGFYVNGYAGDPALLTALLTEIIGGVASGALSVTIGKTLPLSQAAEAHRLLETRQTTGKLVLLPWADA